MQSLKIISGGQCGVDRISLEVAQNNCLITGGYAPRTYMTITGNDYTLRNFGLQEIPITGLSISQQYVIRSKMNVDISHGTLAIRLYPSLGTDCTIGYCLSGTWKNFTNYQISNEKCHRPILVIRSLDKISHDTNVRNIMNFINENNITVLNIAGHREVTETQALIKLLDDVFTKFN